MSLLTQLREANPEQTILSLDDPSFAAYGIVYTHYDVSPIIDFLNQVEVPQGANLYVPSNPALEKLPIVQAIGADIFAGLPIEAGECAGHADSLSAVEFHQGSELNVFATPVVMVLGKRGQMKDGVFNAEQDAKLFFVPAGTVVEFFSDTLHYSPCQALESGFRFIVMLINGSNQALPADFQSDNPMIVKKNKFQVVHASRTDKIAQGIAVGVGGRLVEVRAVTEE